MNRLISYAGMITLTSGASGAASRDGWLEAIDVFSRERGPRPIPSRTQSVGGTPAA